MLSDRLIFTLLCSLGWCLGAGASATQEPVLEIKAVSGADSTLSCTARHKDRVQYRAVRWYKVLEPPSSRLSGLVTRDLPNGTTRWYINVDREVELLSESLDIFLPKVTCSDDGVYMCHLAAPVGEQNRDGRVLLTVTDCPTEKLLTDTYKVIVASIVMMIALLIFLISYISLQNILREKKEIKEVQKETLLDAPLKPLQKKDLMLIYTLGPKPSTTKPICV